MMVPMNMEGLFKNKRGVKGDDYVNNSVIFFIFQLQSSSFV